MRQLVIIFNLLWLDAIVKVIRDIPAQNCKFRNKGAYPFKVAQENLYLNSLYYLSLNNIEEYKYASSVIRV